MATEKANLTKRAVEGLVPPKIGEPEAILYDAKIPGFYVRILPTQNPEQAKRVYILKYRVGRKQGKLTLGVHGLITADKARSLAQEATDLARRGIDPAEARRELKAALTVSELIDAYLTDGPATKPAKRESSWQTDAACLNNHIRPLIGRKIAATVTQSEAAKTIAAIKGGKTATSPQKTKARGVRKVKGGEAVARRTRQVATALWNWGLAHKLIKGENPFASVKLTVAKLKERFLSDAEAGSLMDALATADDEKTISRVFTDALRLLLLTGARKSEIMNLTWREVDFERGELVLPPERTKAGGHTGVRRIPLSPPALTILDRRRPKDTEPAAFVFPAARGHGPANGLRKAFLKVCASAGLEGVRIHDLRHSAASFLLADGASLVLIGKTLGHANARTTERYAHLASDAPARALTGMARRFDKHFAPAAEAEAAGVVVELKR